MNLHTALSALSEALKANIPVMLHGAPGIGKTDGIESTAAGIKLPCLTEVLATMEAVDLRGLPCITGDSVSWSKPDFLARLERMGPEGVLFIDEANSNAQSVQVPLMQLAWKRQIGPHEIPTGWRIVMAGNRQSDRAAAQRMGTALANRLLHLDIDPPNSQDDVRAWAKWAAGAQIHPMVIAFIMLRGGPNGVQGAPGYQPGLLFDFRPDDANARAFPTPRAWSQVSKIADAPDAVRLHLVAGLVGEKAACEFEGFVQVYRSAPPVLSIIANPAGAPVPTQPGVQYAVSLALARAANAGNFSAVLQYVRRVGREFEIVTATDAIRRNPDLTDTSAFIDWAARNSDVTI
ncbi:ATPase associated with various cellular activities AAA_5 [Methylorubrum populi BJ001]|jgi:hypothetical protein|uniref:ATPase associated with various cellular activities AAA_5 n=1 Tax=Methylorubrum populi (strain ATCC BAA-705 / NCIMB 13946 / BJ001) TaxID=441620 RepID=B1ZCY3_METPB|nr:ATPase AAA [Methylorubrum populi]ACB80852.1 ATPase associated with various cellular activities AAA_5 [Methylorubrum populi BJ001]